MAYGAPVFALLIWRISPYSSEHSLDPVFLLHAVAFPLLTLWILAGALRLRMRDGTFRFAERPVRVTAVIAAALVASANLWWFAEYGGDRYRGAGVNFALGCFLVFLPVMLIVLLALGLSASAQPADREAGKRAR